MRNICLSFLFYPSDYDAVKQWKRFWATAELFYFTYFDSIFKNIASMLGLGLILSIFSSVIAVAELR
jgi:hypothetical protein